MEDKQIFISYRRDDSGDVTGRIHEHLASAFGKETIFLDVIKSIPMGRNFSDFIIEAISQVKVMLVIIGKEWANIKDSSGRRRIMQRNDWVRLEIEAGLAKGNSFPVIPIFVHNISLNKGQLPKSLISLINRNGMQIRREPDFKNDVERLIEEITALGIPKLHAKDNPIRSSRVVTADRSSIAIGGDAVGNTFNQDRSNDDE